jgi:ABC-type multidrug transport system fused ATPase/permease subunit
MEPGMKVYQERVISEYKKLTGETATVFFSEFNYSLYASQLTKKKSNKFRVTKIEFLNSDIPDFSWPPQKYNKEKGELVAECDKTGLWTVSFEENGKTFYAVHCCFLTGFKHDVVHITICKDEVYKKIKEIKAQAKKKAGKPKIGVFTGNVDQAGTLDYTTYKKSLSSKTVYHKVKETILKDIENFNKNLASSIKNGEKGTRKILIAGPQGTGKSSFIQELMRMYQNKASIMIAKSLDELGVHLQLCSKYKVPAIVVLEDCESFL